MGYYIIGMVLIYNTGINHKLLVINVTWYNTFLRKKKLHSENELIVNCASMRNFLIAWQLSGSSYGIMYQRSSLWIAIFFQLHVKFY